ncbi:7867_t:CDS:10 [Diversispora eburnea]|uniref:7867_t:CDS:1 n=1 Tax=Diversispora eburnea TaxID=1213867 RepID=A0A9N9AWX0_9GLOM|nr:7867_t:CDS:10 [Diversispora eburnea]
MSIPPLSCQGYEYKVPPVRWFQAIDVPSWDPFHSNQGGEEAEECPMEWIPFSKHDSAILESAYSSRVSGMKVTCSEDHLFEVDLDSREISPIYWIGPIYQVVRASWFYEGEGGKFIPCDEFLSDQIEDGYIKHQAWIPPQNSNDENNKNKNLQERSRYLTDKYSGQYVVYLNTALAWLIIDDLTGKLSKTFFSSFTNGEHLGGVKLLRGYWEVEKYLLKNSAAVKDNTKIDMEKLKDNSNLDDDNKRLHNLNHQKREIEDYEEIEEPEREIDHLILCIHGIGQKLNEKKRSPNFVNEVNLLRRTIKQIYASNPPSDVAARLADRKINSNNGRSKFEKGSQIGNGIQVLPINWRQDIKFGMASEKDQTLHDLSLSFGEGQPTLDEIKLDSVPNLRMLISDALVDVLLYMTPKFRDMILKIVVREMNRVYNLFIDRNPNFLKIGGKVSIYGHSLGSLVAFDVLCHQSILTSPFNNDLDCIFGVCPQNDFHHSNINNGHHRISNGSRLNGRDGLNCNNGINGINQSREWNEKKKFTGNKFFNQLYDEPECLSRDSNDEHRLQQLKYKLDFEAETLYSVGSPIGLFLLLKGVKIGSRKYYDALNKINESNNWSEVNLNSYDEIDLNGKSDNSSEGNSEFKYRRTMMNSQKKKRQNLNKDQLMSQDQTSLIPLCYPAVNNIYNIFHKSDPIAYRLEPLISRHCKSLKPALIPYHKGGLKAVQLASDTSVQQSTKQKQLEQIRSDSMLAGNSSSSCASLPVEMTRNGNSGAMNVQNVGTNIVRRGGINGRSFKKRNGSELHKSCIKNLHNCNGSIDNKRRDSVDSNGKSTVLNSGGSIYASSLYKDANGSVIGLTAEARRKSYQIRKSTSAQLEEDLDYKNTGEERLKSLNKNVGYLSAISVHLNYWTDCDVAHFILQETYKNYDDGKNSSRRPSARHDHTLTTHMKNPIGGHIKEITAAKNVIVTQKKAKNVIKGETIRK